MFELLSPSDGPAESARGAAERLWPQLTQKAAPSAFCVPHFGQNTDCISAFEYKSKPEKALRRQETYGGPPSDLSSHGGLNKPFGQAELYSQPFHLPTLVLEAACLSKSHIPLDVRESCARGFKQAAAISLMEVRRWWLLLLFSTVATLFAYPLLPSNAASGDGITLQTFASPSQVLETQNFTLTALISNTGKANATALQICLIAPPHWNSSLQGSTPTVPKLNTNPCVQYSSSASSASVRSSLGYSLLPLQPNGTEFLQFQVNVPPGTPAGQYTLFLLVSSSVGNAQESLSIQSSTPASLPLGGVLIPVSLALILLPGFMTLIIAFWMNKALSSSWQSGVAIALLSFAFGYAEWAYFSDGFPSENPLSSTQILTLDPTTIGPLNVAFVLIWSVGIGLLLGAGFYGGNVLRGFVGDAAQQLATKIQEPAKRLHRHQRADLETRARGQRQERNRLQRRRLDPSSRSDRGSQSSATGQLGDIRASARF